MNLKHLSVAGLLTTLAIFCWVFALDAASRPTRPKDREIRLVEDPERAIERAMEEGWISPERQRWRIEYKPIDGMSSHSEWHIQGTHWWVRLYPEEEVPAHYRLGSFDKSAVYEIDGVALQQAYGTIKFWVYGRPQKLDR